MRPFLLSICVLLAGAAPAFADQVNDEQALKAARSAKVLKAARDKANQQSLEQAASAGQTECFGLGAYRSCGFGGAAGTPAAAPANAPIVPSRQAQNNWRRTQAVIAEDMLKEQAARRALSNSP
ncbi:hypothetical protein GT347_01225 [Xylophilus rhododendri]|uniref:Uncharacterized protein n=1 Tax=Xylophilus rhododendri TaxID=2697032 RepID=A0A857J0W2_9BURK|nr:hypothetical protein [Xylophilus rhododendri]QHI96732.1 hypothetical protein GT347_01225 [Xylophilus rhododendri]